MTNPSDTVLILNGEIPSNYLNKTLYEVHLGSLILPGNIIVVRDNRRSIGFKDNKSLSDVTGQFNNIYSGVAVELYF